MIVYIVMSTILFFIPFFIAFSINAESLTGEAKDIARPCLAITAVIFIVSNIITTYNVIVPNNAKQKAPESSERLIRANTVTINANNASVPSSYVGVSGTNTTIIDNDKELQILRIDLDKNGPFSYMARTGKLPFLAETAEIDSTVKNE